MWARKNKESTKQQSIWCEQKMSYIQYLLLLHASAANQTWGISAKIKQENIIKETGSNKSRFSQQKKVSDYQQLFFCITNQTNNCHFGANLLLLAGTTASPSKLHITSHVLHLFPLSYTLKPFSKLHTTSHVLHLFPLSHTLKPSFPPLAKFEQRSHW